MKMIKVYSFHRIICVKKIKNKVTEKLVNKIARPQRKSFCFQGTWKFTLVAQAQNFEETLIKRKAIFSQIMFFNSKSI